MEGGFSHRIRVRFNECDPQGVVFNANYFTYIDLAVTELWREAFGHYNAMLDHGADMVVAEATARFRAPAAFDEEIDIGALIKRLGTTSLTTAFEIRRGDTLLVEAEIRHVFIDPETKLKMPIPDEIRRGLEPYAESVEAEV
jgi:acyl-CoA thioester hydrolase